MPQTPQEGVTVIIEQADDYDAAFAEAAKASEQDGNQVVATEEATPKEESPEPKTDDVKATESKESKQETEPQPSETPLAKVEKETDDTDKGLEQRYKSLQGMYNQLIKEVKELKEAHKTEEPKPAPTPEVVPEDTTAMVNGFFETLYTDLDDISKKTLTEYNEEFKEISKVEDIKLQHGLKKMMALVEERQNKKISDFAKALKDVIQPLFDSVEKTSQSEHYTQIKLAHSDFETYRDNGQLMGWIDEQPKFLKESLMKVYKTGNTEDVIDMYTRFKKDKGLTTSSNANGDGRKKDTDDRIRNLETVKSKSAGVNIGSTGRADDFDSAFDEALSKSARR